MKKTNKIAVQVNSEIEKAEKKKRAESAVFINLIFHNLKLMFPAWRQNFKTEKELMAAKSLWLDVLIDENIVTQEQITRALKAARCHESAFFPSIGQFIGWTKEKESEWSFLKNSKFLEG